MSCYAPPIGTVLLVFSLAAILPAGAAPADSWTPLTRISRGIGPHVLADGETLHLFFWECRRPGPCHCFARSSPDQGLTWGPPVSCPRVKGRDEFSSREIDLSAAGGRLHLVGRSVVYGGKTKLAHYWKDADAGEWQAQVLPNGRLNYPRVAATDTTAHMTWWRRKSDTLHYRRRDVESGALGPTVRLARNAHSVHDVAATGRSVHVVWRELGEFGAGPRIFYRRSDDDGITWTPRRRLQRRLERSYFLSLAATGRDVHVAWTRHRLRPDRPEVSVRTSRDGGRTWASAQKVVDVEPDVFVNGLRIEAGGRDVLLSWLESTDDEGHIHRPAVSLVSGNRGRHWRQPFVLTPGLTVRSHGSAVGPGALHFVTTDYRRVEGAKLRSRVLYRRQERRPR